MRELMRASSCPIERVYILVGRAGEAQNIAKEAHQRGIPCQYVDRSMLQRLAGDRHHQGVIARVTPFRYAVLNEILADNPDLLLILDGVTDPRNLGALLRTAEAVGVGGVVLPHDRAAEVTPTAEKAAAGATAHLRVCQVTNIARTVKQLCRRGYWAVGLWPDAPLSLFQSRVGERIAMIIGGEHRGIRPLVRRQCDLLVSIPMRGKIHSLNVAVAGGIALYVFRYFLTFSSFRNN